MLDAFGMLAGRVSWKAVNMGFYVRACISYSAYLSNLPFCSFLSPSSQTFKNVMCIKDCASRSPSQLRQNAAPEISVFSPCEEALRARSQEQAQLLCESLLLLPASLCQPHAMQKREGTPV
jgi:hypothetical protein